MISCKLMGGLGNQMFQIAATYNLALINNDTPVFNFDNCLTTLQGSPAKKYKNNIFSEFKNLDLINTNLNYYEIKFSYDKIYYEPNLNIVGYFQSEKYFLENKNEICNKFILGLNKEIDKKNNVEAFLKSINLNNLPIVTIHIRRGDYLNYQLIHKLCTLQYYENAISLLKDKIGDFTPIIISDDKQWCKEQFKNYLISPFLDELEDMLLMVNADHNIIANSTFSWWGAYLNNNENKIVISPSEWFGENGHKDQDDIIPNKWIKIK